MLPMRMAPSFSRLDQVLLQPAHQRKKLQDKASNGTAQSAPVVGSLKVQVRRIKLGQERSVSQKAAVLTGKVAKASARAGSKYMRQVSTWVQRTKGNEGASPSQGKKVATTWLNYLNKERQTACFPWFLQWAFVEV